MISIPKEKVEFLHTIIRRVNALAPIFDTSYGEVDLALMLSTGRLRYNLNGRKRKEEHTHGHEDLQASAYTPTSRFKARELDAFFEDLTSDVYRIK